MHVTRTSPSSVRPPSGVPAATLGCPQPAVSQTTLMVRVYGALLQAAAEISGPDAARDPYWTLVGYFNSLRVLGAAELQVRDDVEDRIGLLAHRSGRARELSNSASN